MRSEIRFTLPGRGAGPWWLAWDKGGDKLTIFRSGGIVAAWDLPVVAKKLAELEL
jgi:hypothetical protein